jgi:hypothetical protein
MLHVTSVDCQQCPALRRRPGAKARIVILTAAGQPLPYNLEDIRAIADVTLTDAAGLPEASRGATVLFLWDFFSTALYEAWPQAEALQWVHVAAAGVDAMMFDDLRASQVVVTNAHGTFDQPIAEFVLASVLAHDKQLHLSKQRQRQDIWQHRELIRTGGTRALVVGTGGIGRATARLLRAVGMEVAGVGRTSRTRDPDFGHVYPSADVTEHVGWADHLVLIAPLTVETRHMVNGRVLAAMKPSSHLPEGMPALVDDDLRFVDGPAELRPTAAVNRWLRERPASGAPTPSSWANYARAVKAWMEFLAERGVGLFDSRKGPKAGLSRYA